MYKSLLVLLVAAALGACQTTGGEQPAASAKADAKAATSEKPAESAADAGVRCKRERQIGSHMRTTNCTTREQRERDREEARHYMNRKADPGLTSPGGN